MTDIIDRLKEPEAHYPGNFDTPKRANAMLSCLCQEAMEEIESLRQQVAEKDAEIERLKLAANIGKSKDVRALAEILLSDCGCSTEHRALLDKVENRLWTFFDEQLAAIQAREQELRGAFQTYIDEHEECTDADDWMAMTCSMEAHHVADEALAQPADTTALQAMIAKAGEVMRERCAKHFESCAQSFAEEYGHDDLGCLSFGSGAAAELRMDTFNGLMEDADAIRSIPAVTLDDLKCSN